MTPLQSLESLTDKVWNSWSGERLSGGVGEFDSFHALAYDLGSGMQISDDIPLSNAGAKISRSVQSLEKQTRSWRMAVNLSQEGREMDIDRWVGDLEKTKGKITAIQTALERAERRMPAARASGEHISAGLDADDFKKAYLAGEHTKKLIDEAAKAARKVPRTASASRVVLRYASEGMAKEAGIDLTEKLYDTVRDRYSKFEAAMQKTMQSYMNAFEKALLKQDFVMDRRKSYINYYMDREGIYPEGELHFIDKRDHQQRDRYAVEGDIQKLGFWGSVMGDHGMWKVRFGGK